MVLYESVTVGENERRREEDIKKSKDHREDVAIGKPWQGGKNTHTCLCQRDVYEREARIVWHWSICQLIFIEHSQYGPSSYLDTPSMSVCSSPVIFLSLRCWQCLDIVYVKNTTVVRKRLGPCWIAWQIHTLFHPYISLPTSSFDRRWLLLMLPWSTYTHELVQLYIM